MTDQRDPLDRSSPAWRWISRAATAHVSLVAAGMIALQVVFRVATLRRTYYWEDDFSHLVRLHDAPLSWDLLVRDYNDHLEILTSAVFWVLASLPTTSFLPAAIVLLTLQVAASVLTWLLLTRLFGPRPMLLLPFAMYLFSPLWLVGSLWLAAGLEALPLQVAIAGALYCLVRWHEEPRPAWLVGSLFFQLLGVLWWEKGLVVLPVMLAVQVLLLMRGRPVGERWRGLLGSWRLWAAHLAVWIGYVVLYISVVDGSERGGGGHDISALTAARRAVLQVFLPGLVGAPWTTDGADNTVYPTVGPAIEIVLMVVLLGLVAVSLWLRRGRAVSAWVLLAGYIAGDVGLMIWGRAGHLALVARDPRYVLDGVLIACLCLAAAFLPVRDEPPLPGRRAGAATRMRLAVAAPVAVVIAASTLLASIQLAPVVERTYSRNFVRGMITAFENQPGASVVNMPMVTSIATVDQRDLLGALGYDAPFDVPGTSMWMFDGLAQLRQVEIREPVLESRGPLADCGWSIDATPKVVASLSADGTAPYTVLRLGYLSGMETTLQVKVGEGEWQHLIAPAGLGEAWFVVGEGGGDVVVKVDEDEGLCISDVRAGMPWPR